MDLVIRAQRDATYSQCSNNETCDAMFIRDDQLASVACRSNLNFM